MPPADHISTSEAARLLGVSASTVRNWLRDGRLQGSEGAQPQRPRLWVRVDEEGMPLGSDSVRNRAKRYGEPIERRIAALERQIRRDAPSDERFRDAALQLSNAMEIQRHAFELQLEATKALNQAVSEQATIVAGLLVGDPLELVNKQVGATQRPGRRS